MESSCQPAITRYQENKSIKETEGAPCFVGGSTEIALCAHDSGRKVHTDGLSMRRKNIRIYYMIG